MFENDELIDQLKKFKAGVYAFKTIAGENVVAYVDKVSIDDDFYMVKNPVLMIRTSANQESPMPWITHGIKDQIFIVPNNSLAVMPFIPNQDLLNMYNQLFGSGIVTVPAGAMPTSNNPPRNGPRLVS